MTNALPHDPILGDDEEVEGVIVPNPTLILQITVSADESRLLAAAARAANVFMNRYIKQIALTHAEEEVDREQG